MTQSDKDVMQLALDALINSVDLVFEAHAEAVELYSNYPSQRDCINGLEKDLAAHNAAIDSLHLATLQPIQPDQDCSPNDFRKVPVSMLLKWKEQAKVAAACSMKAERYSSGRQLKQCFVDVLNDASKAQRPAPTSSPPVQTVDTGPWQVNVWSGKNEVVIQSHQFKHDTALIINGDFSSADEKRAYADALCMWMNSKIKPEPSVQPQTAKPPYAAIAHESQIQAQPVGWLHTTGIFESYLGAHMDDDWKPVYAHPPITPVNK